MSGTETDDAPSGAEPPVAFQTFAASLRPALIRDARGMPVGIAGAGHPDEIWLKYLRRHHGRERHTMAGWAALIDARRHDPAHPAGGAA